MKLATFAFLLFSLACSAKPTAPERSLNQSGKATREADQPAILEFWAVLERGPSGIDGEILTQPSISDCLRENVTLKDPARLNVQLKGSLNSKGSILSPAIMGGTAALAACFKQVLGNLVVSNKSGQEFVLRIIRGEAIPPGAKPFAVELKGPKKFE